MTETASQPIAQRFPEELVSSPLVILASAFLAAAGLYGLARRDLAERRFLALIAVAGILVVTAGYAGPLASPLFIHNLLRGPGGRWLFAWERGVRLPPPLRLEGLVFHDGQRALRARFFDGVAAMPLKE